MKKILSKSVKETHKVAKDIAKNLKRGDVLALVGDLGGGKTTFVKGLTHALGIKEEVQSPTFTLIREYQIKNQEAGSKKQIGKIYHMDMYRLKNESDAMELGLEEIFAGRTAICLIEWADKIKKILPKHTKFIEFDFVDETTRRIIIK